MKIPATVIANVDAYISGFPEETQKQMKKIRATIKKAAPGAEELVSYRMPAYKYHGILVYFAAYKNHIGFYPTASGIERFKKEISVFKNSKGAVQFPLHKPLPLELITKMVVARVKENLEKEALKTKKKKN